MLLRFFFLPLMANFFFSRAYIDNGDYLRAYKHKYMKNSQRAPIGTTATTGQMCPESGVWKVVGTPSTTAPIAKGDIMPPYGRKAVVWKLVRYA